MKSSFKILGVRADLPVDHLSEKEIERVKRIQKRFFGNTNWQYFYDGVTYGADIIRVSNTINDDEVLYGSNNMSVSVSSIVGKNGAGKSTILDLIIRIINNVGASIIGENYVYSSAEHLHYVDYLYADLMILQSEKIKVIKSRGRLLSIDIYEKKENDNKNTNFIKTAESVQLIISNKKDVDQPLNPKPDLRTELSELFYTCIFNYSIYAYNYRDYMSEETEGKRLSHIMGENEYKKLPAKSQYRFWHTGLFHKNDGYQTPIVLNPMREEGVLNGANENERARDRLLSMIFYQDSDGKFPFRDINKSLKIVGLSLSFCKYDWNKKNIESNLNIRPNTNLYANLETICNDIKEYFINLIGPETNKNKRAYNYLAYKTIKIFRTYNIYKSAKRFLDMKLYDKTKLKGYLDNLILDESHITVKLRRTVNYLRSGMYFPYKKGSVYDFAVLDNMTNEALEKLKKIFPKATKSDLVPPPIFETAFRLVKNEDIKDDGTYDDKNVIPFEGLSSGERQLTYTISNFVYHLVNVNSVWDRDVKQGKEVNSDIKYRYINAIFDEVELYYHPDLQRCFLSYLINALKNISLNHIEGVNILIVTHSPFIISDIPKSNIMFLKLPEDGGDEDFGETLCSNIYDMLNKSFFMKYTVGQLAQEKITDFFNKYRELKNNSKLVLSKEDLKAYQYLVDHIGDEHIQKKAKQALLKMWLVSVKKEELQKRINEIDSEKSQIEKKLKNLNEDEKD
ncbi:AAA family ATPase [Xylanibacter oryzae]|uniref:AAA family ATPase n=1 Tax=Xylanibacter oryzae TaxID=185293 RepID=UPI0004AE5A2A|nr:AAA family ATPase [Xylanibacter oryzae]